MEDGEYDMAALCDRAKGGGAGGGDPYQVSRSIEVTPSPTPPYRMFLPEICGRVTLNEPWLL